MPTIQPVRQRCGEHLIEGLAEDYNRIEPVLLNKVRRESSHSPEDEGVSDALPGLDMHHRGDRAVVAVLQARINQSVSGHDCEYEPFGRSCGNAEPTKHRCMADAAK